MRATTCARSSQSPIEFSSQFAQILRQSLGRQSESTAEAIGLPGLVLECGGGEGGEDQDGADGAPPAGASADDRTGSFVWGAGASLAALLWRDLRAELEGRTVLELGAGTAVVSIAAAAAGARLVVATDAPSRLAAARRNVELNRRPGGPLWREGEGLQGCLRVAALDWAEGATGVARVVEEHLPAGGGSGGGGGGGGEGGGGEIGEGGGGTFDWILGADLTYAAAAMAPLARTVRAAMGEGAAVAAADGSGDVTGRWVVGPSPPPPPSSPASRPTVLLAHRPRSRQVDAAMHAAFAGEGLELRADEQMTARLASLQCGGGEMEGDGDGEPMVLFRVVVAAAAAAG